MSIEPILAKGSLVCAGLMLSWLCQVVVLFIERPNYGASGEEDGAASKDTDDPGSNPAGTK